MTKLVEAIAKSLVDNPEGVVVTESEGRQGTVIELRVAPEDMGKVIGKQGRIAKALRTVVKAAATEMKWKIRSSQFHLLINLYLLLSLRNLKKWVISKFL